jgi:hypothetical protein
MPVAMSLHGRARLQLGVAALLLTAFLGTMPVEGSASPATTCVPEWSLASLPNDGANTSFYGSAASSSTDVWAVGSFYNGRTDSARIEHWNGSTWAVTPSPRIGSSYLQEAVTLSPSDAWAVGYAVPGSVGQTLAEHWDGTNWKVVASPSPSTIANYLVDVSAVSPDDVWAVGYDINSHGVYRTLIEHWDGTAWSLVPSPNVGSKDNLLNGVSAVSASNVWAVGSWTTSTGAARTLAEHWDGVRWRVVPSPSPSSTSNALNGVVALSSTDVWAGGSSYSGTDNVTLVEHWNGTRWSQVFTPNVASSGNVINAMAAGASGDVWSVGYYYNTVGTRVFETLTEHWDGATWTLVDSPNHGTGDSYLNSVVELGTGATWAMGTSTTGAMVETTCL